MARRDVPVACRSSSADSTQLNLVEEYELRAACVRTVSSTAFLTSTNWPITRLGAVVASSHACGHLLLWQVRENASLLIDSHRRWRAVVTVRSWSCY